MWLTWFTCKCYDLWGWGGALLKSVLTFMTDEARGHSRNLGTWTVIIHKGYLKQLWLTRLWMRAWRSYDSHALTTNKAKSMPPQPCDPKRFQGSFDSPKGVGRGNPETYLTLNADYWTSYWGGGGMLMNEYDTSFWKQRYDSHGTPEQVMTHQADSALLKTWFSSGGRS